MESMIYHDNPSVAANAVRDIAETGGHVSASGREIKLDAHSLLPDKESAGHTRKDGDRGLATQYLNVWMVNAGLNEPGISYRNHETDGEQRVYSEAGKEPRVVGKEPGLGTEDEARAYHELMGNKAKSPFMIVHSSVMPKDKDGKPIKINGVLSYDNQEQYRQIMTDLQKHGKLPVVTSIDTSGGVTHPQGVKDNSCRASADEISRHAVALDSFSKGLIDLDNQWGSKCDIKVPIDQLFKASIDPDSLAQERLTAAEKAGKYDFPDEVFHLSKIFKMMSHTPGADASSRSARENLEFMINKADQYARSSNVDVASDSAKQNIIDFANSFLSREDKFAIADKLRQTGAFKDQQDLTKALEED